jgi:hypothetical protein
MLIISGQRLRIGTWVPAWYLSRALLLSSCPTETEVVPVLAAPWKRSARTDWVWRRRDQQYPLNGFGGEIPSNMGRVWGEQLFETEVAAWEYAHRWYLHQIAKIDREAAEKIAFYDGAADDAYARVQRLGGFRPARRRRPP